MTGRVCLSVRDTLWLDPIEERVTLKEVGVTMAVERPQSQMLKCGIALPNTDHLVKLAGMLGVELCWNEFDSNITNYK